MLKKSKAQNEPHSHPLGIIPKVLESGKENPHVVNTGVYLGVGDRWYFGDDRYNFELNYTYAITY